MTSILVDTGPLYALADQDDGWHARVSDYVSSMTSSMVIPITVFPEVCYLMLQHLGARAELQFIRSIVDEEIRVEYLKKEDVKRTEQLMRKYLDVEIGFVDASLVAVAERLNIREVLTTDRRHFSIMRPKHCAQLTLQP